MMDESECENRCKINRWRESHPKEPVIWHNDFIYDTEMELSSNESLINDYSTPRACVEKCARPACEIPFSDIKQIYNSKGEGVTFHFHIQRSPAISIEYKPKMEIVEFLVLVGSIPGLWLGLSLASSCEILISRIIKSLIN